MVGIAVAVEAAQAVKAVAQFTEYHSLQLTRNLLRIAFFHVSYIRKLFPDDYFLDTSVASLDVKVKKLLPMDLESRRLIDWIEKGVYDALKKKYLKTMLFTLCEGENGPTIEEYSFSFKYCRTSEVVLSMHMTNNGHHNKILMEGSAKEIDHQKLRESACKMIKTFLTLMQTLDGVSKERFSVAFQQRTILVKLLYYDDVTPIEYEPPYFRSCTFDIQKPWQKLPFKRKAGEVNSSFFALSLKVKGALDSCEDEIEKNVAYAPISTGECLEGSRDSIDSGAGDYDCKKGVEYRDSKDTFDKGLPIRKASMVEEPILIKLRNDFAEDQNQMELALIS